MSELKYLGYHDEKTLPVRKGDRVTILKGTPITNRGRTLIAKKTYKITVHHVLPGVTTGGTIHRMNPMVCWPGPGGYWSDVDINLIPEANLPEMSADRQASLNNQIMH